MKKMNIQEVLQLLPHRYPFMLVDCVVDYQPNEWIKCIKNVTINEPYFVGHFPVKPVMPGVLIVEALAQASAIMAYADYGVQPSIENLYYFAGIENVRFKRIVEPGDQLLLEVSLIWHRRGVRKVAAHATVNGEEACKGDLIFAQPQNKS